MHKKLLPGKRSTYYKQFFFFVFTAQETIQITYRKTTKNFSKSSFHQQLSLIFWFYWRFVKTLLHYNSQIRLFRTSLSTNNIVWSKKWEKEVKSWNKKIKIWFSLVIRFSLNPLLLDWRNKCFSPVQYMTAFYKRTKIMFLHKSSAVFIWSLSRTSFSVEDTSVRSSASFCVIFLLFS